MNTLLMPARGGYWLFAGTPSPATQGNSQNAPVHVIGCCTTPFTTKAKPARPDGAGLTSNVASWMVPSAIAASHGGGPPPPSTWPVSTPPSSPPVDPEQSPVLHVRPVSHDVPLQQGCSGPPHAPPVVPPPEPPVAGEHTPPVQVSPLSHAAPLQ